MRKIAKFRKIKKGEYSGKCQEKDKCDFRPTGFTRGPCKNQAAWAYKGWRYGDVAKGEDGVVDMTMYFCDECRERIEESWMEVAAETAIS
jgi:hypothetical protein